MNMTNGEAGRTEHPPGREKPVWTDLRRLRPEAGSDPAAVLEAAVAGNVVRLEQAPAIPEEDRVRWARDSVAAAAARVGESLGEDSSVFGAAGWRLAAAALADECAALARILPDEAACLHTADGVAGMTARLVAERKLCRAPARGLTPRGWRERGRRLWMRRNWTGPKLLWEGGGWEPDAKAAEKLGGLGIHAEDLHAPAFFRVPRRGLAVVEFAQMPRNGSFSARAWSRVTHMRLQSLLAWCAGLRPDESGIALWDPAAPGWTWHPMETDLKAAREEDAAAAAWWRGHVLTGRPPESAERAAEGGAEADAEAAAAALTAYAAREAARAFEKRAAAARGDLQLRLRDAMTAADAESVSGFHPAGLTFRASRQWRESDLRAELAEMNIAAARFETDGVFDSTAAADELRARGASLDAAWLASLRIEKRRGDGTPPPLAAVIEGAGVLAASETARLAAEAEARASETEG